MDLMLLFVIVLLCNGTLGGRFHCRPRGLLIISIGRSTHTRQPDYLVIEEDLKPEPHDSDWRMCSWVLELDAPAPRQVVLRGIPRSSLSNWRHRRSSMESTNDAFRLNGSNNLFLLIWFRANKFEKQEDKVDTLSLKTFLLFHLNTRDRLTLSIKLPRAKPSVSIAVSVMEPGYCAQDMVIYDGKCHLVIEQQNSSLTEAMQIISSSSSAGLQLASFTSLEEIKTFVKTNYEPEFDLPPKQPLDLTKPVRIGLFYSRSSNSVFESVKTDNGCEMRKLRNSEEFVCAAKILVGACGAIQANTSDSAVILFVSCNHSMPSLISFPETAQNTTCTDCYQIIDKWLGDENHQDLPKKLNLTMVAIIASLFGLMLLVVAVLPIVLCCCRFSKESKISSMDRISKNKMPPLIIHLLDEQCSTTNSQIPSRNSSSPSLSSSDGTTPLIVSKVQSKAAVTDMPTIIPEDEEDAPTQKYVNSDSELL